MADRDQVVPVSMDFLRAVDLGMVGGFEIFRRFGSNPDIQTVSDPEEIWDVGGLLTYPTSADTLTIVSADADDTAGGTGARTVTITYLDSDWAEQTETLTLSGATPVGTSTAIRFIRATVASAGSSLTNEGALTVKIGAGTVGQIAAGAGQTLMTHYTVPAGKTAYMLSYSFSQDGGASNTRISIRSRPFGGAFNTKNVVSLEGTGATWVMQPDLYGYEFPAKTDIQCVVDSVTQTVEVTGQYILLLVDDWLA